MYSISGVEEGRSRGGHLQAQWQFGGHQEPQRPLQLGYVRVHHIRNPLTHSRCKPFSEGDVDLLASDEYWDPHAIAGLLKTFMRELPASILTRELHTRFLSVIGERGFLKKVGWLTGIRHRLRGHSGENKRTVLPNITTPSSKLFAPSGTHRSPDSHRSKLEREQDDNAKRWDRFQPNTGNPCRGV